MPRSGAAFLALLLVFGGASHVGSSVLPPTDVSVTCRNFRVTVSWECSQHQRSTSFKLIIKGAFQDMEVETTTCQYDLTSFLWRSEKHYMDNYCVTVVAVEGGERSEPVMSRTFSFNRVKSVDDFCFLDFPPVDIIPKDSGVMVTFDNPFNFYPELRSALRSPKAQFTFLISSNHSQFDGSCLASDETCKRGIHFAAGKDECVTLEGTLFDSLGVGQIQFKKTKNICKSMELNMLMYLVPLAVAVPIIAMVLVIICVCRAWTLKQVPLPGTLILSPQKHSKGYYNPVSQTTFTISKITVKPSVTPQEAEEEDENELGHQVSSGQDENVDRFSPGSDYLDSDSNQLDTRSTSVCSDFGEESAYNQPHMCVDLGDGEFAEGYRE